VAISKNLKMNLIFASVGILLAGTSVLVQADTVDDIAAIKNNLEIRTPPIKAKSIKLTPLAGLYEVFAKGNIYYVDKTVSYVMVGGSILDGVTKKNLTAERLKELTTIKFADLPLKNAIEIKKGTGAYKFAVFTDPDCPYCKTLEQGLDKMAVTDYTAYVFLHPLKELHPDAIAKSESIWCAKDQQESWLNWMVKGTAPVKNTCDNPIESNAKLANDLGVAGTPTIYLNNGNQTQNPQELLAAMKEKK
jgi:thiol:disulfide interchange protein DsbC